MSAYLTGTLSGMGAKSDDAWREEALNTNILLEKRARKQAEEDATKLYNRVRQLQKEEEKAQKRIVYTKKKANEIVRLRERNELIRQEKELRMLQLQELIEQQRVENQRMKEEAAKNKVELENRLFAVGDKVQHSVYVINNNPRCNTGEAFSCSTDKGGEGRTRKSSC
jgi:hypothetical protein